MNRDYLGKHLPLLDKENPKWLGDHVLSSLSNISADEGACFGQATSEMWDLTQPKSPCVLPPADHPQRRGSHQQSQCPFSSFQRQSWYSPGSHSTGGRASQTCWTKQVVGKTVEVKLNVDVELNSLFSLGECGYFLAISNRPISKSDGLDWIDCLWWLSIKQPMKCLNDTTWNHSSFCANLHLPKQMWETLEDKYASRPLIVMIAVFIRCLFSALHRHKTYFFLIKDCFQVIREAWTRLHSTGTIWMNEFGCLGVSGGEPKKTGNKKEKNINNLYFEIF